MVGGSKEAWNKTKHIFEDIAAKNHNESACCFFGSAGSGHFVKLVHNGIEYALMEAIAEVTNILDKVYNLNNNEIAKKFKDLLETNSSKSSGVPLDSIAIFKFFFFKFFNTSFTSG